MRLSHIKLAGFKSFVDPTHIPVPGDLVGVVGPNGCGKSNIIDAVRWVLGESKASALRGESMQDVIFNGSGNRKPVGRASVELAFDNSLGKAAGQWSQYAEIAIKRVLERDGESSYFINNLHVRRRDISDLFLGTGVGGRGYAIIEQGMISRIIEAKPEELRVFLEEAAGVSKYRERRRETELRLGDTRENLQRVDDIRQELERQLEKLEDQAQVAARYKELQGRLQTAQHLFWLIRKQDAATQRVRHETARARIETDIEAETAKLREAERLAEERRASHYTLGDALHAAQGELYASNAEVARLEQQAEYIRQNRVRLDSQIGQARGQLAQQEGNRKAAEDTLAHWRAQLEQARRRVEESRAAVRTEAERMPAAEQADREARDRHGALQRELMLAEQAAQIEETHRGHALRTVEQLEGRRQRLAQEQQGLPAPDPARLEGLRAQAEALGAELAQKRESLARAAGDLPAAQQSRQDLSRALREAEAAATQLEARISALEQLQRRLEGNQKLSAWLAQRGLQSRARLWQGIRIEAGWEDALEAILRERLNALEVVEPDELGAWLGDPPPGRMSAFVPGAAEEALGADDRGLVPLANYVSFLRDDLRAPLGEWLSGAFAADEGADPRDLVQRLRPGEVAVTRQGHLLTPHGAGFYAPESEVHGVLARQREIDQLREEAGSRQAALAVHRGRLAEAEAACRDLESAVARLRQETGEAQQREHGLQMELLRLTQQDERLVERRGQIERELGEIAAQAEEEGQRAAAADAKVRDAAATVAGLREHVANAREAYAEAERALNRQRNASQEAERGAQEAAFFDRTCQAKIDEQAKVIAAVAARIAELEASLARLQTELEGFDPGPVRQELQQVLEVRQAREQALAAARDALEGANQSLRDAEQARVAAEHALGPLRDRIGELRLKEQEARLAEAQYAEQLAAAGAVEEQLAPLLEKGARATALQAEMTRLNEEITALGAVNLAALEELTQSRERKGYLDAQAADLREAVETLENAIRRIDRESRERLMATFDEVNGHLAELFPALFGGGHAKLVLTGEEILDSGVQVIAQPPGKKNASIHLLSGGEKALTALSLVFALFQLNPAPFCLLDEVDAPLDDSNTERFCQMVRRMSAKTQFMFISHNKITMEMAQQLVGITMQEKGVSRVVAVDIDEAMKMTEAVAA